MTTSTSFAQMANNLLNVLQGCSKSIRLLLVMFLTLTVSANVWGATETYEKVTSAPSDWSGEYLIVYEGGKVAFDGNLTSLDAVSNTQSVTITNNQIKLDSKYSFTITKSGTNYTIKSASGKYIGIASNSNGLTSSDAVLNNTISINADKTVNIVSSGGAYLRYNATSVQTRFRYYKSSSYTGQKAICLYKKVTAVQTVAVTSVSLNKTSLTLTEGSSETLTASVLPANATDKTVTWSTSDANIATVSNGKVTAVAEGTATITVTTNNGNKTATCNVTVNPKPKYTVKFYKTSTTFESVTEASVGAGVAPPSMESKCGDWTFRGWSESQSNSETSTTELELVTLTGEKYYPTEDIDLYPVYTKTEGEGGSPKETLSQTLQYDIWSYSGSTTDKSDYRLFHTSSYIESAEFDLSTLSKVIVYGGTFGGDSYNKLTIAGVVGAKSTTWKSVTVSGKSQTGVNTYTDGTSLSGIGKLRVTSNSGSSSSSGVRISKIMIYTLQATSTTYYYSYPQCTTEPSQLATPTNLNVSNITSTSATLSWGEVANASSYTVQVYGENDEIIAEYTDLTQTTKEVSGLESDTYYIWAVTAIGDGTTYTDSEESETAEFTTQKACEQLGAATNLTVVTNFVQDGQTYVKFSWTPADNTKANATNQKICFGKVDEAGTCVDDLAKNLTWTGDLASKLSAGEYWWSIQALGDGTNYCDGDVVKGSNFTIYSITYDTNGGNTIPATSGTTLPDPLPTPTREHYNFEGWYTDEGCTQVATAGAAITQNTTLYAKWTAETYTITLNANGGKFVKDGNESETIEIQYVYGTYVNYDQAKLISDYLAEEGIKLSREGYQLNEMWQSNGSAWKRVFTAIDRTIQAQWSKLYSITLSENGTTTELTPQTSTSYTLPEALSVGNCENDEKELVGWSTVAIPNPGDKPTSNFYELGETVTLTADQTTFYAVFATAEETTGGTVEATLSFASTAQRTSWSISQQVWEQNGVTFTHDKASGDNIVNNYGPIRCYKNSKITITHTSNEITKIVFDCNTNAYATDLQSSIATIKGVAVSQSSDKVTVSFTSAVESFAVTLSSGQVRLDGITVTTGGGTTTTYSDYTTSCVALPDPVISFVTTPADPIVFDPVNCGSTTSKAQAKTVRVSGENLRDVVNVSVTGPYKIARTSSTALNAYTTSLTLDKTAAGAIHSNYQTVYIISTPPAQSTEATTGTLTFTTTKGNTLTVNLSTPTVTCTQYTLTLVDRGVSTEQPTKYYAGETINEAPADPEGVCTDPIHYVFDGWAEATVAAGATTYDKVTFPHTVEGNTKFYAVYRYLEEGSAISGDYEKVTENLDDYSGDYLFVYETGNVAFDGGLDDLDVTSNTISVTINSNTIASNATTDAAKFTIAKVDGGYSIQSASGYYIGRSATSNGLSTNETYSANYDLNTITDCKTIKGKGGSILKYNKASDQKRFRYYQSGQEDIALYRKAASYLYTTSPVCGPHLVITDGKEIYVTGGNAQAARDLVMAQQKVSYKAIRLNTKDGSAGGTAPDVVVADNGITKNGIVTSEVKVTFENTIKEQQADGSYTITGDIVVTYEAEANNLQEDIQVQLAVDYNSEASDNFTVHARSLPSEFVIVAKSGNKWYALNADMSSSKAQPANGQVKLNDPDNPTEATYAPCNAIYTFEAMPQGAEDRISVRFIGMENKYLWAASEGNNGVQNYSKAPAADALAYNWKLYTEDNITYHFGNAQNTRMLGLHSTNVAFGMYANGASVVQDIRILPYVEKCIYNYAPTNLKVSVLKGTYVTLTWDAVAGATKYQYSTDATSWTDCGTEPTVTINGLTGATKYTYYIRAYHEDAGVSQECIDYAKITFTTANCDDVPTNITYTADLNSITVSWTAAAPTATITYNTKEDGTGGGGTIENATSPRRISGGLNPNTTYYIQILADGTCASPIIPVKTEDVEVDIVEWMPDGIIVDINTDETVGVTLENEVAFGTGVGKKAEDIFFSKYFEANGTAKILAIYNGTDEKIDLSTVSILNDLSGQSLDLAEFGHKEVGYIYPNEEIILFSKGVEAVTECSEQQDSYPDWYNVEHGVLDFGGRATLILKRGNAVIDIIGSVETQGTNYPNDLVGTTIYNIAKFSTGENEKPSWGDDPGWVCESGDNIMTDVEENDYPLSTNRCLLVRKNTVISGVNAVAKNINKVFATLCDEWVGLQIPKNAPSTDKGVTESCEGMAFVGDFDYSDYYTKYVSMGDEKEFDENARNADGTVTIPITDLYKQSCRNIRIKLSNSNGDVLTDREYKVPIMITTTQGTDGQTFLDLQQNLATVEVDGDGNVINTYPLSLDDVREICKTCDVVVRDNATLTKVTDGTTNDHPQVRNVYVYEGASIVIPDGENHNYTINGLSLRRKGDEVASAQVQGTGKFVLPADEPVCLDLRVDANNWHWFTLPYDCLIEEVTWVDGTPAKYNTDWFLMYYDGESRAASTNPYDNHWKVYEDTKIEAGKGYIVGITGDLAHPDYTFELRFPMAQDVLTDEQTRKTVPVNAWGVKSDNKPNNRGWNLVGNPYLNYYKTADEDGYSPLAGLPLIYYTYTDPVTGEWYYENSGNVPYVATPIDGGWYEYRQELASEVNMMPFTAYFVQVGDPDNQDHTDGKELNASFEASNRGKKSIVRRAPAEIEETEEPIIVRVELTNSKGESDKTSLVIDDRFTNEYEMNGDFFKWFGDYYNYYTKPVLYTIGADQGKRAFNALNEELAKQPIPMGMYAAQAGNYTFSLNQQFDLSRVEEVWLYDATQSTYTNLMQSDYTFSTSKVNGAGRFSLSVKLAPKVATSIDNVTADKVWATTHTKQVIVNGLENGMHLWLYDATGKLLYNEPTSNYQHTYAVPQTGTYFVSVMNGNQKQTIKVVVE